MKIEYINPFINSINNAMETMVGISPERKEPVVKEESSTTSDVSGMIGFAEKNISGSVALSFPSATILKVFEKMMGAPADGINGEVEDIVGELTNIVVGGAKKEFSELGYPYHLSIPMVVSGKNHSIKHKHDKPITVISFSIDSNDFTMEISLKVNDGAT